MDSSPPDPEPYASPENNGGLMVSTVEVPELDNNEQHVRFEEPKKRKRSFLPRFQSLNVDDGVVNDEHTVDSDEKTKEKVEHFFQNVSYDGLAEIYEATSISVRILWISIVVICTFCLCYELYNTIVDFRDNPILTTYSLVTDPSGMKFPHVYICPANAIHRLTWKNAHVDPKWEQNNTHGLSKVHTNNSAGSFGGILAKKITASEYQTKYIYGIGDNATIWTPNDIQDYFLKVGYPKDIFIKECAFNGVPINCTPITTEIFDADYGKCFLISFEEGTRQKRAGVGLTLVLDLDIDNAHPTSRDEDENLPEPFHDGALIKVDDKLDVGSQHFSLLSAGTFVKMSMETKKMNLIQREKEKGGQTCSSEEEGHMHAIFKLFSHSHYTQGICQMECIFQTAQRECNCIMPVDKRFLQDKHPVYCSPTVLGECVYPALEEFIDRIQTCTMGCAVPCEFWKYRADISSASYPATRGKYFDTGTLMDKSADQTTTPPVPRKTVTKSNSDGTRLPPFTFGGRRTKEQPRTTTDHSTTKGTRFKPFNFGPRLTKEQPRTTTDHSTTKGTRFKPFNFGPRLTKEQPRTTTDHSTTKGTRFKPFNFGPRLTKEQPRTTTDHSTTKGTRFKPFNFGPRLTKEPPASTTEVPRLKRQVADTGPTTTPESVQATTRFKPFKLGGLLTREPPHKPDSNGPSTISPHTRKLRTRRTTVDRDSLHIPTIAPEIAADMKASYLGNTGSRKKQSDLIIIDIFFSSLQYVEITQENSMTFSTFIGNIGGQVGLWAGASVVTMIKFFIILSPFCCFLAKKKAKEKHAEKVAAKVWKQAAMMRFKSVSSEEKRNTKQ